MEYTELEFIKALHNLLVRNPDAWEIIDDAFEAWEESRETYVEIH